MKATTMDWSCSCGVSVTNIPIVPMKSCDICQAAIESHRNYTPCRLTLIGAEVSIRAVRHCGKWYVTISPPAPSIPNPKRRQRSKANPTSALTGDEAEQAGRDEYKRVTGEE